MVSENVMNPVKKIIIEEAVNALREVKQKEKIKNLRKDLYESVKTSGELIDDSKKKIVANKLVRIAESRLFKHRNNLKESQNQFEDETDMAKAQLLAIIEKANELYRMMNQEMQLEDWVQYKLSIAENYIDAVHGYMKYFIGGKDMDDNMEREMDYNMDDEEWDDIEEEEFDDQNGEDYYDDGEYDGEYDDESFEDFEDFEYEDDEDEYTDEFDEDDEISMA